MPGIDHVVICAADLGALSSFYEDLGFTLTPQAQHPFGTGNRLAQLDGCFIELLSVTKPEDVPEAQPGAFSFGAYNRDYLARAGDGMSMLALKTNSWQDDRQRFRKAGLPEYEPFGFGRTAKQPDGTEVKLDFRLTFATDAAMPDAVFFTCDHRHPPAVFWKPDYQAHANGAEAITDVYMAAADPSAHAGFLEKLFGPGQAIDGGLGYGMDDARLHLLTPDALEQVCPGGGALDLSDGAARFAGFGVRVRDAGALGQSVIPPDAGFGAFLTFHGP